MPKPEPEPPEPAHFARSRRRSRWNILFGVGAGAGAALGWFTGIGAGASLNLYGSASLVIRKACRKVVIQFISDKYHLSYLRDKIEKKRQGPSCLQSSSFYKSTFSFVSLIEIICSKYLFLFAHISVSIRYPEYMIKLNAHNERIGPKTE